MEAKTKYISKVANSLVKQGKQMTFDQLATDLNTNGHKTSYGSPYIGGRGVAKLVDAVYWRLDAQGLKTERDNVAASFTDANGNYSYDY